MSESGGDVETASAVLALEKAALQRWCAGDPSGFLELSAPDVVYFDPFRSRRIDGLEALRDYYEGLRGTVSVPEWEIVNPCVQCDGDVAVLTFDFDSGGENGGAMHWHCTEVYRRSAGEWRIIQTHWSLAPPR